MNPISLIFSISLTCTQAQADLQLPVELYCKPASTWDRGYDLELVKKPDNTYSGNIRELKFYGRLSKFSGTVKIEIATPDPHCILKLTNEYGRNEIFELILPQEGEIRLTQVNGRPVEDVDQSMVCRPSKRFVDDVKQMCSCSSSCDSATN